MVLKVWQQPQWTHVHNCHPSLKFMTAKKKKHINDIAYLRHEAYKLARLMNKFCDAECDFFSISSRLFK